MRNPNSKRALRSADPRTRAYIHGEAAPKTAQSDAFVKLYPGLLIRARGVLSTRHLRLSLAEDLVQEAISRWLRGDLIYRSKPQTESWLRRAMERIAKEWSIRSRDPLDQHPASLDQPWARPRDTD